MKSSKETIITTPQLYGGGVGERTELLTKSLRDGVVITVSEFLEVRGCVLAVPAWQPEFRYQHSWKEPNPEIPAPEEGNKDRRVTEAY